MDARLNIVMELNNMSNCKRTESSVTVNIIENGIALKKEVTFDDSKVTGSQILNSVGKYPVEDYIVLALANGGILDEVDLFDTKPIDSNLSTEFLVGKSDRILKFELNGRRYPWLDEKISLELLKKLGAIPTDHELWQEKQSEKDSLLEEFTHLGCKGLEKFYSKKITPKSWKFNVQNIEITSDKPKILVSEALKKAGFDAKKDWILILKTKGQPKKAVALTDCIDLSEEGIEKLRLTPKEINNGEAALSSELRKEFSLLEKDEEYLAKVGFSYETFSDMNRRWLRLKDYQLPEGYVQKTVDLAFEIPTTYPVAQLDMFYCHPHVARINGNPIPLTQTCMTICGASFQRWSRHLSGVTRWNPSSDSVISHLAVIEESLLREVGQ